MSGTYVKFWEGRQPTLEYFAPLNPYEQAPQCNINLRELSKYAKSVGKKIVELTYDEISRFFVSDSVES